MKWDFKEGIPIWQQIGHTMQIRIVNGTYPPGSKLPTVRELALEAGVNPNTMQRALSELERDELVYAQRTAGRFVSEDEERLTRLREDLAREKVEELFEALMRMGLTPEQIAESVGRYARKQTDEFQEE
ncbi:MAG: GntR family transcriptional regulator [Lachnospiraceae bacterium]|nr:GntR family transcriptional regulator [Lachnospiraceae bacterium]